MTRPFLAAAMAISMLALTSSAVLADQPGDLVRDDRGLAAAGTGQHQERTPGVMDGGLLGCIEAGQSTGLLNSPRIVTRALDRARLIFPAECDFC